MGSLYKKLVIISVIITILIVALVFSKTSIIKYVYHNRVFAGPSMETKRKGVLNRSINFKFSIADAEFINSFGNTISNLCDRLHTVNLDVDGEEYAVDICRFNSYFKYIDIQDVNRSLSLRFPDKHFYQGIRNFDMFQIDEIDLFEQELLYKFARKIDLLVPYTQYMKILVHNAYNGLTFLKQAYDDIFLEQNQLPHSIIFMVQRNYTDDLEIKTLYNPFTDNRQHERKVHLNNFLEQLKQEDPNLLVKYFDLDYIGRFELLRQLMEAGRGFVMEDNVKFVYNTFTGKFYPVLDESNLYNMQRGKDNGTFKVLAEQIAVNPLVEGKKRYYMLRLVRDYDELLKYYTNLKAQYVYSNKSFANKFRIQLISRYFEDVVFKKLKQYTDSKFSLKEEGTDFFL
ncbi:MAG: hypothetical protein GY765_09710, partial [bacterium]|nr:hypothetical protein [bacterium]